MLRTVIALAGIAVLLLGSEARAEPESRFALVIGNERYGAGVGALKNPSNDIKLVGAALKQVGFQVQSVTNASRSAMLLAVNDLAAKLKGAGNDAVGFVYYSGHGLAAGADNYLIPVDVAEPSARVLSVQGVTQAELLGILRREAPNAAHYLVLDACRNSIQGTRGGKGFGRIEQQAGALIAFSTEPGKTASDNGQGSGPYAAALAAELVKPGQNDLLMFHNVRVAVMDRTGNEQVPWTEDGIQRRDRVVFGRAAAVQSATAPSAIDTAPTAARICRDAEAMTNLGMLAVLERQHKGTPASECIAARIAQLKTAQVAAATPTRPAPSSAPAEPRPSGPVTSIIKPLLGPLLGGKPPPDPGPQVASEDPRPSPPATRDAIAALVPGSGKSARDRLADGGECSFCPEMVVVPAGSFIMGSNEYDEEKPQHRVTIAKAFAVGRFEVTFAEWDACVADRGCKEKPSDYGWGRGRQPVINVSWEDITIQYLPWLSRKSGKTYRLLSEAEWEYAARAGTTTAYFWGNTFSKDRANNDKSRTVQVGQYPPNGWGLHDMHGNVLEWAQDCWHDSYRKAPADGTPWSTACTAGGRRVVRGGAWDIRVDDLRSTYRFHASTGYRDGIVGFRVGRTLDP